MGGDCTANSEKSLCLPLCAFAPLRLCVNPFAFVKTLNVDLDLVKKYNVAGPRYTSYPPATKFTDANFLGQLSTKIDSEQPHAARSLGLFPHPVLRNALLVLRLHDRHHAQSRQGQGLH